MNWEQFQALSHPLKSSETLETYLKIVDVIMTI